MFRILVIRHRKCRATDSEIQEGIRQALPIRQVLCLRLFLLFQLSVTVTIFLWLQRKPISDTTHHPSCTGPFSSPILWLSTEWIKAWFEGSSLGPLGHRAPTTVYSPSSPVSVLHQHKLKGRSCTFYNLVSGCLD